MKRREFYFRDDKSNKFWTVEVVGTELITTNGRIGATPRETRNQFASAEEAEAAALREIAAKQRKGYQEGAISSLPEHVETDWSALPMNDDVFWRIIKLFNWKKTGDDDEVMARARNALATMPVENLHAFQEILAQKLYALDTQRHAAESSEDAPDYISADGFLYWRCCVVANGRETHSKVLLDPTAFKKDYEFESLLYLAPKAAEQRLGADEGEVDFPLTSVSFETFSNTAGWPPPDI